ncbi:MAG: ShlB/FhaC/HecB family hemolysin secretion/activation protein [Candidatus Magnetomorum sp.]|nr:ShlB/FhaC/HecB family hemolysin secretion/activation protein [Candidatus Magnetomorum sp.]
MKYKGLNSIILLMIFWTIAVQAESQSPLDQNSPFLPSLDNEQPQLSQLGKTFISKIHLKGNTVFDRKTLDIILTPYENKIVTAEELHDIKNKLTLFYISKGYVNSGCVLGDQRIEDGQITYHIIEGTLDDIRIEGNHRLKDNYIRSRVRLSTGDGKVPFNINDLQTRLKLLKQEPVIDNINTYVRPGLHPGEAQLKVVVQEARPYQVKVDCHNHNSPGIGSYRGDIKFSHSNFSGWADSLAFHYGGAEGLNNYLLSYQLPINRFDTRLKLEFNHSQTRVVSKSYSPLDIQGDTSSFSLGINHFLYRTPSTDLTFGMALENRVSHTEMLGKRISFSSGVEDGISKVSVFRFTQQWLHRSLYQVIAFHSSFNLGLDLMDATIHEDNAIPDGQFKSWLGQIQWIRRLALFNSQVITRLDVRIADDSMLAIEKFSMGGFSTVRGYRENLIVSDSGYIASLEWRIPVGHCPFPGLSQKTTDGQVVLAPFLDYGKGSNHTKDTELNPDQIYSAGLGFRWQIESSIFAELYWGSALKDVENEADSDIQDDGVHFLVSYHFNP